MGGTEKPALRDQNWVCGTVRQVLRTGTMAKEKDSIQTTVMLYLLPSVTCRSSAGEGWDRSKITFLQELQASMNRITAATTPLQAMQTGSLTLQTCLCP